MTVQQTHTANAQHSYTLASHTSQRTDQSLPKSMPAPTHGRQKRCSKLKEKMTENKKGQLLVSGHKTLGFKWLFECSASHQPRCGSTDKRPEGVHRR